MKSWQTTLGGALGELGTALAGAGTITSLVQLGNGGGPSSFILYCTVAGFVISCIGRFFTALAAPDKREVQKALDEHTEQIKQIKGDTVFITPPKTDPPDEDRSRFTRAPNTP